MGQLPKLKSRKKNKWDRISKSCGGAIKINMQSGGVRRRKRKEKKKHVKQH